MEGGVPMYVCYIDESGHCGKKYNPKQPVEVLCGVRTDLTKLFKIQRQHSEILQIFQRKDIPLSELKASDVYRGRKHWSVVVRHTGEDVGGRESTR